MNDITKVGGTLNARENITSLELLEEDSDCDTLLPLLLSKVEMNYDLIYNY